MTRHLLIVESPSKAKTLKKYLGRNFEVLASYGHVRDLEAKEGAVDPEDGFRMRYALVEKNKKHVDAIARAAADADLLLVVIDGAKELSTDDESILAGASSAKHIVALNKSDLPQHGQSLNSSKVVHVSAVTGEGLDELAAAILEPFGNVDSEAAGLLITDSRHFDLLCRAEQSLKDSRELMNQGASEEIDLVGLHNALRFLGEITGETTADDILAEIFSTFCIGK